MAVLTGNINPPIGPLIKKWSANYAFLRQFPDLRKAAVNKKSHAPDQRPEAWLSRAGQQQTRSDFGV